MSLQWTAVATFLYAEVFAVLLLCIPFISPKRWQKIFKSRLVELVVTYGNTFFVVLIVILVLLVIDAVREIRKYDDVTEKVNLQNNPGAVEHFHMKLFRAQRNLYIAGFSLLLSFLLRRLVTLISQQATLLASNEAFKKQAESASDAAKKYMEENDLLKKVIWVHLTPFLPLTTRHSSWASEICDAAVVRKVKQSGGRMDIFRCGGRVSGRGLGVMVGKGAPRLFCLPPSAIARSDSSLIKPTP
uniref:B-cell receptor-associated protein n=1 Tax=Bos mutus grunniens TaxID=30521 RepID=A0A8C0AG69_BOSMU